MALLTVVHCLFWTKENYHIPIHISMITVEEFRNKQATGSRHMFTDEFYTSYFFIKNYLNCFEHVKGDYFFVFEVIFLEGVSQNLRMINGHFKTTSGLFFGNYMNIFYKTWHSEGHFELFNRAESQLVQKSWRKMQIFSFCLFLWVCKFFFLHFLHFSIFFVWTSVLWRVFM